LVGNPTTPSGSKVKNPQGTTSISQPSKPLGTPTFVRKESLDSLRVLVPELRQRTSQHSVLHKVLHRKKSVENLKLKAQIQDSYTPHPHPTGTRLSTQNPGELRTLTIKKWTSNHFPLFYSNPLHRVHRPSQSNLRSRPWLNQALKGKDKQEDPQTSKQQ
jgi:hypothetical protein